MDPYKILGIDPDCSNKHIKDAYHEALLKYHPDKRRNGHASAPYTVENVRQAYQILQDPGRRAALKKSAAVANISATETVDLSEMSEHEKPTGFEWTRSCRCGQAFLVTEQDLEANGAAEEIYVQCGGCSLWLKVVYQIE